MPKFNHVVLLTKFRCMERTFIGIKITELRKMLKGVVVYGENPQLILSI